MSNRIVIVSGGELDEELTLKYLKHEENSYIIGVDKGVEFLYNHKVMPNYIVGDFDSANKEIADYYRNETNVPVRDFNPVKDESDTEIAIRLALTLGCKQIIILGATGGRIDHLWANIQTLTIPHKAGVEALIIDKQNRIRLIDEEFTIRKEDAYGKYFSIFPLGGPVYGVLIEGAKYPLRGYTMTADSSMCVSNQFAEDEVRIAYLSGTVIFMETKDK